MNLPNKLTVLRIYLIPVMLIFMLPLPFEAFAGWNTFVSQYGMIIALLIFSVASYTDHLDGAIARKHNIVTNLGKFMDPIADKLLVLAAFTALVEIGRLSSWVPIIILFREFSVTGIRLLAMEKGTVIAASKQGKLKTVTQNVSIILLMLEEIIRTWFPNIALLPYISAIVTVSVLLAVAMTIISGVDYLLKNRGLLTE
ncbi:MAG: CDP-diacylglycerol--glycerol-3-phosphate 3-phosphatidyltransferase [Clostridiaceae bacterium]|nr:CDP-diacylglycerol--glycerol-3-phosphate 3-phosphatidyltransferase [Clostridiaceae bacterium]